MKISILEGHHQARSRHTKSGERHFQIGYAHAGGAYPVEFQIPLNNPGHVFPVGDYLLSASSFRVGKFSNLELNPFQLFLEPISSDKKTIFGKTG